MADIVWKSVTLPNAFIGEAYEAGLAVTGAATAVTGTVVKAGSGALPPGVAVASDFVRLTGTPTSEGVYSFKLTMTDTAGGVDSGLFTIAVMDRRQSDVLELPPAVQVGRVWPQV